MPSCQTSVVPQCCSNRAKIHGGELSRRLRILQTKLRTCKETGNFSHCYFPHWNPLERINAIKRVTHLPFKVTCKWRKMSLWPYFWLSYEGLESWQRFEAVLGFFHVFSVFVFLLEFNSHLPWHSMAKVKSSNRRGLMLVHLREGHMVTHGLPPKE